MSIHITLPGCYAPQGRKLRSHVAFQYLLRTPTGTENVRAKNHHFEMETAGIYGLASSFGQKAINVGKSC